MSGTDQEPEASGAPAAPARPRRSTGARIARAAAWAGATVAVLLLLAAVGILALNSQPGRGFVARTLSGMTQANGLQVRVGRIDGSLYGRMVVHDLELRDPQGVFLTSPEVTVDWRPAALTRKHLILRELSSPLVTLLRRPALRSTPPRPNQSVLPDFDITVDRLALTRIVAEAPVTGRRQIASATGMADIVGGRARLDLQARAVPEGALAGGDTIVVRLDARPSDNRLALDARVDAPADGLVAALAGLDRRLQASVSGRGTWAAWDGRAVARLGDAPLADLALAARSGRYSAKGQARPAALLPAGPAARLTEPAVAVDLAATADGRRYDTRLHLASAAFDLTGAGVVDLGRSRFGRMRLDLKLLRPGAVLDDLAGRDVNASITLDGDFATPTVEYLVQAASLSFGTTGLQGLRAEGRFRVDRRRTAAPIRASVARVTGVPEAVGGVLRNLRADGDVVLTPETLATDNLRFRSDRMNATLVFAATLKTGQYTAALKGQIDRYAMPGVGVFDLVTNARIATGADGQPRLTGDVRIATVRVDNESVRDLLGGRAVATATFQRSPAGVISFANLRVNSPKFQVTQGAGSITADGRISINAQARSEAYGPISLAVSGTTANPRAQLRAPDPNLPGQLTEVEIDLTGRGGAYTVDVRAASAYGPVAGRAVIRPGPQGLAIDLERASAVGLALTGRIQATPAGPFAGELQLSGSGLSGVVRLSAAGGVQRADVDVRAEKASLALQPPLVIDRGSLQATVLLQPGAPTATGQFDVQGLRREAVRIETAAARFDYRGGQGQVTLNARGGAPNPFSVALQAALAQDMVRVSGQGDVGGVPIRLTRPAEIRRVGEGWRLEPTVATVGQGRVQVNGAFGQGAQLSARLRDFDLAVVQAFAPAAAVAGRASGDVDFTLPAGGGFPTARANLNLRGVSRTGVATSPQPVDVSLTGELTSAGARTDAVVRRRGAAIGRLQARLGPFPASGGDWMHRVLDAPVSGGVRYNGPAEVLWALSGIEGQEVSGPVAIGGDVSGRASQPQITGVIRAKGLTYQNPAYGTVIRELTLESRFTGSRLDISSLSGRAGDGTLAGSGYVDLSAAAGFPIDLQLRLTRARLANSDNLNAVVSGQLAVRNSREAGSVISGRVIVEEARYRIVRQASAEVPELAGVRRRGAAPAPPEPPASALPSRWRLDVAVEGSNQLFVEGMGLDAEWRANLRVTGDVSAPMVAGQVELVRGTYSFAGRRLDLSRGEIQFTGQSPLDPLLDIQAQTTVEGVTAIILIGGSGQSPQITFSSTPVLPQDEILSRLLFGSSITQLSPTQALQLAAALNSLRTGGGGLNPLGTLRRAAGVDRLNILGADAAGGRGTALSAGKYISNRVYVEVITDARGFTAIQLEIALNRALSLLSQVSSLGGQSLNLRYSRDY